MIKTEFGSFELYSSTLTASFEKILQDFQDRDVLKRLWNHDYTLWSEYPDEIVNRLGWLHLHETMQKNLSQIDELTNQLQSENYSKAILLGMGGSSLAPEVFKKVFGTQNNHLDLEVLDSTDPGAVKNIEEKLDLERTIFIVSTKSGGTVETLSFFKYFYNLISAKLGQYVAGSHFIAITDPGSKLEQIGSEHNFRKVFLNDPNIGGRYSALSYFGLVPAALLGIQTKTLLLEAAKSAAENGPNLLTLQNSNAALLGVLIGIAALKGKDKLTFISDSTLESFSDWVEQLLAESTGKSGKGILPVVGEQVAEDTKTYGSDRIFILQQIGTSKNLDVLSERLQSQGYPVARIQIENKYQIGALMLVWEIATALAGAILQIHPFNQPNVESAKVLARNSIQAFEKSGKLPEYKKLPLTAETLDAFLVNAKAGNYIGLHAYVNPSINSESAFRDLQSVLRNKTGAAVTFGFGPRFLHSTGQLHKGDSGNGLFIQFISRSDSDIEIPQKAGSSESVISFDILKQAQALGDSKALEQANRKVITFELEEPVQKKIREMTERIK